MADVRMVGASKDFDLRDLNTWIKEREQITAPVVGIAKGQSAEGVPETGVSLDLDQDSLERNFAKVKLKVGDAPVVAATEVLVCEGKAYISGVLTAVFVVRKKT